MQKQIFRIKEKKLTHVKTAISTDPKNPAANVLPSEGYLLEVDGKFKSEYETSEQAMKVALELKKRYPQIQVNIFGAKEQTRTLVALPQ